MILVKRWPCLEAFDRGDDLALWIWTYRVWDGFRWPRLPWGCAITVVPL